VAYYYGYQLKYAARKSYIEAIISGLHQIRPSIERDAASINEKLLEAGKL
jgi:membrane-bound lytic murein transglycosylase MltF